MVYLLLVVEDDDFDEFFICSILSDSACFVDNNSFQ